MTESTSAPRCPTCARPIAAASASCLYCGAPLTAELRARAQERSDRILRSATLPALSATALALSQESARRYFVLDVAEAREEDLSTTFALSPWEARQWLSGPRYRLIRVASEADPLPEHAALRVHVLEEEPVQRARTPVDVVTVDDSATAILVCQTRVDPEGPLVRREVRPEAVRLIVSAPIRRERSPEIAATKRPASIRLEDGLLAHLHLEGEPRPLEIDPRRTAFEGPGPPSAFMRTLALLRHLEISVPHDESFRLAVPALAPVSEADTEVEGLRKAAGRPSREPRKPTHDNSGQFRAYSAWRGVLARRLAAVGSAPER